MTHLSFELMKFALKRFLVADKYICLPRLNFFHPLLCCQVIFSSWPTKVQISNVVYILLKLLYTATSYTYYIHMYYNLQGKSYCIQLMIPVETLKSWKNSLVQQLGYHLIGLLLSVLRACSWFTGHCCSVPEVPSLVDVASISFHYKEKDLCQSGLVLGMYG